MTGLILLLLVLYLHLGWCWVSILSRIVPENIHTPAKYFCVLVLWPLSLILLEASQEDDDDYQY